jgi:hypothetical protein
MRVSKRREARAPSLGSTQRGPIGQCCVFVRCAFQLVIILWVALYQKEQNGHRRNQCPSPLDPSYAHPSVRLGLRLLSALCRLPYSRIFLASDSCYKGVLPILAVIGVLPILALYAAAYPD